jgi:hypothetical protein
VQLESEYSVNDGVELVLRIMLQSPFLDVVVYSMFVVARGLHRASVLGAGLQG